MSTTQIGILTGGGDCPGLNAVIRAVVLSALSRGWETFGIRRTVFLNCVAHLHTAQVVHTAIQPLQRAPGVVQALF